jgi:hypothetical protein
MLRFLIIFALLGYVLYKIGAFFFKIGAVSQEIKNFKQNNGQPDRKASAPSSKVKGGEYVDFEEVK